MNITKTGLKFLKKLYRQILASIAFYPVLISFGFLIFGFIITSVESVEVVNELKEKIPYLIIRDPDVAQTILSTMIGGIFSLTVFSFSMVMVVLNQASSNYSPRLLPGLISNKKHQIILGVYIGTLLYNVLILISLGASDISKNSVGLSTMIAAIFGVVCVSLFVYFIDTISKSIQIYNIIDKISANSYNFLEEKIEKQEESSGESQWWRVIRSNKTGYYKGFDSSLMSDYFEENKNVLEILPYKDQHIWEGMPIMHIKEKIPDDELKSLLLCFHFSPDKHEDNSYTGGMIKLMEVAVKAMSPGINDPGTAIDAVTKIGPLLDKSFKIFPKTAEYLYDDKLKLIKNNVTPDELMRLIIQPIRQYAKQDSSVMYVLINTLLYIKNDNSVLTQGRIAVNRELELVRKDITESIFNEGDRERIELLFQDID